MSAEPLPIPEVGPRICRGTCGRRVVARTLWAKYDDDTRKRLGRTHARYQGDGMCCTCYRHTHPPKPPTGSDMEWPEDAWILRKGIWYPVGPRPIDAESPNPAYRRDPDLMDLITGIADMARAAVDAEENTQ